MRQYLLLPKVKTVFLWQPSQFLPNIGNDETNWTPAKQFEDSFSADIAIASSLSVPRDQLEQWKFHLSLHRVIRSGWCGEPHPTRDMQSADLRSGGETMFL
jgi:hypothetical protein